MPPYHATVAPGNRRVGGLSLLPLRQTTKGSGRGLAPITNEEDIVDQTLDLFKANIFFKNFEVESEEDKVLLYLTLYTVECLKRIQKCPNKERAVQEMYSYALEPFSLPGDAGFPLNAFFNKPNQTETDDLKQYMIQLRHETGARLVERVFAPGLSQDGKPSKWWTSFSKRKFLNVSLGKAF